MISLGIFVVLNSWLIYSFVFLFLDTKSAISKVFTINYNDIAALSDFALFQSWDPLKLCNASELRIGSVAEC